jgi:hypothetical protein
VDGWLLAGASEPYCLVGEAVPWIKFICEEPTKLSVGVFRD